MAPQHFKWPLSLSFAAGIAGARVLWTLTGGTPSRVGEFVPLVCPLLHFFNIHCPTCGLGRSMFLAFNGQFSAAFSFHFLGPVLLTALSLATVTAWIRPQALAKTWAAGRSAIARPLVFWSLVSSYCLYGFLRF